MSQKILFIMHMPPPVHGAAVIGKYIHDSKIITEAFDCLYINPAASQKVSSIGKLSLGKMFFIFSLLSKIVKTVMTEKPALCYMTPSSWDWGFYRDCLTVFILKRLNVKIVFHFHNRPQTGFGDKWYNKLLYRHFFRETNYIFLDRVLTNDFKDYLDKKHLYICPNGIEPVASNFEIKSDSNTIKFVFLSNLIKNKGVYDLLEACKILKSKKYNFICDFIGKSGDISSDEFIRDVEKYGLSDIVTYLGPKYDSEKYTCLSKHDVLVFPTSYETFGLVLLEAMQVGLMCIGTKEGAIPNIISNKETGLLIEKKDSFDLAAKMEYCINNRDKVKIMGQKGKEKFFKLYTKEIFEQNITNILKDCIKND